MKVAISGGFRDLKDAIDQFDLDAAERLIVENATAVAADYNVYGYEGDEVLICETDGEFYEIQASHCSCNDLSGQKLIRVNKAYITDLRAGHLQPELQAAVRELWPATDTE